jgi:hypothetical protein
VKVVITPRMRIHRLAGYLHAKVVLDDVCCRTVALRRAAPTATDLRLLVSFRGQDLDGVLVRLSMWFIAMSSAVAIGVTS